MNMQEFNAGFEKFLVVYLRGMNEKDSCKELGITHSRWAIYTSYASPEHRIRRRNAMKIKAEAQRALSAPKRPTLDRSQIMAEIASLLRGNGVHSSMKSYQHCSNVKLIEVRDRLRRNRSDKYQLQTS